MSSNGRVYVVFEGCKPGINFSWVQCHAQVDGFKGNSFKGYDTYDQATTEWKDYCTQKRRGKRVADGRDSLNLLEIDSMEIVRGLQTRILG